ncbi:hypothetical protein L1286_22080 [Pseudoalteromonas sp. SMS1]|uniref:hypothetical protein n=1 Tax=Pseudoalteromonas sp. SMS1 TaxID=2908894 RepID=UPI001F2DC410|nr:hypothetical protein [Pseudoalteromonas sp. SMS1]MCF2860173.1 hypothetical protein [Pseudoalteromonas sp. SMS1]
MNSSDLSSYLNSYEFHASFIAILDDSLTLLTFLACVAFVVIKDKQAFRYSFLCLVFYIVGAFTFEPIKAFDDDKVYRYILWALNDIIFIAIVAYWALKDKMYMWQSIMVQLVVLPAPLLQLFRLVDRHLMDLSYSTYLYKSVLPIVNTVTVALCFVPLLWHFGQKLKWKDRSLKS